MNRVEGKYFVEVTSFKGCRGGSGDIVVNKVYSQVFGGADTTTYPIDALTPVTFLNKDCNEIAAITGGAGALGLTTVMVTRPSVTPTYNGHPYVKRFYQIMPAVNSPATITIRIPQSDFGGYNNHVTANSLPYNLLPSSVWDASAASHIAITQFLGLPASGTTGPGGMYDSTQKIDILPSSITASPNYGGTWTLTFPVSSLAGGYYIHSNNAPFKEAPTSISSLTENTETGFSVYPNPTNGLITIETTLGSGRIQLMDLSGKIVSEQSIDVRATMDMSGLAAGLYILRYSNSERTEMIKLTKE